MGAESSFPTVEDLAEHVNGVPLKGLVVSPDEVWFPYSVEAVKLIREGLLLAARNTASVHLENITGDQEDQHFSLLRVDNVETRHFVIDQIRQDRSDAPVSVEGLLEKHQREWRRTSLDPEENNLRLVLHVSESGLEIDLPMAAAGLRGYGVTVRGRSGVTMLGEVAYLMRREIVEEVVNRGMDSQHTDKYAVVAGSHTLYRQPSLDVLIDVNALFRRHFGLFGFTGAGKSNLLSTIVARSMSTDDGDREPFDANIVLFDVNNEFFGLLVDVIVHFDSHVVFLDDEVGGSMGQFLGGDFSARDAAADEFLRTTTLPREVSALRQSERGQEKFRTIVQSLMSAGRFKRYVTASEPLALGYYLGMIGKYADDLKSKLRGAGQQKKREAWSTVISSLSSLFDDTNRRVVGEDFRVVHSFLEAVESYCSTDMAVEGVVSELLGQHVPKGQKDKHYADLLPVVGLLRRHVRDLANGIEAPMPLRGHGIDLSGLGGALHDKKRTLIIFLGAENTLRMFSEKLGSMVYDSRRRGGVVDPASVFIFDEADIFIPGQTATSDDGEKEAIRASKKIATTLARRGRKYGLGIGIATQRITYLDTSILAQLGTYFVGRLPRLSDRQKITEGFGVDKDSLQAGINNVGDWVILSHTAVGDKGNPIPVHFSDANRRILSFVTEFELSDHPDLTRNMKQFDCMFDLQENSASFTRPVLTTDHLP